MSAALAWQSALEIWGDVVSMHRAHGSITILFTTTPAHAKDPVFLTRWKEQAVSLIEQKIPIRSAQDQKIHYWMSGKTVANRVAHLVDQSELGFDLFGVDLVVPPQMPANVSSFDHDGSIVRLDCRYAVPMIAGLLNPQLVALQRLSTLYTMGAKPFVAARVQANNALYSPGNQDAPAFVVFSPDAGLSPMRLEEIADTIFDYKLGDSQHPVRLAAARGPRESDEGWYYHRRYRLPTEITDGRIVYAADVWVQRAFLPERYFSKRTPRLLPVIAEPGELGGIELVPFDRAAQLFPPEKLSLFQLLPPTAD